MKKKTGIKVNKLKKRKIKKNFLYISSSKVEGSIYISHDCSTIFTLCNFIIDVTSFAIMYVNICDHENPLMRSCMTSQCKRFCYASKLYIIKRFFMPPKELWEAYSNRTVRPSVRQSVRPSVRPSRFRVRSISPIFFEVGIPNLVCGYILGWRSVAYHFRVTVTLTLTSDLVFRIIVSGAYLLYYLR